ncbi:MAG: hydroxymethylpyrimidine/phosphomethylpyrimidine kinase [Desulfurobacteriaceae bacterium]
METKFLLTIAGFDPTGGAGIIRDIRTFSRFGFPSCAVITVNTVQNTKGVRKVAFINGEFLLQQLDAVLEEADIAGVKIGIPHDRLRVNREIAEKLTHLNVPVVFDPVLSPTFGKSFVEKVDILKPLLSASSVITPNFEEFRRIERLLSDFSGYAVVKGIPEKNTVIDRLLEFKGGKGQLIAEERHPRDERVVRGTGCAFSSAILAYLAAGRPVAEAFKGAVNFIRNYREKSFKRDGMEQYYSLL